MVVEVIVDKNSLLFADSAVYVLILNLQIPISVKATTLLPSNRIHYCQNSININYFQFDILAFVAYTGQNFLSLYLQGEDTKFETQI